MAGLVFLLVFWVLAGACQRRHGAGGFVVQCTIIVLRSSEKPPARVLTTKSWCARSGGTEGPSLKQFHLYFRSVRFIDFCRHVPGKLPSFPKALGRLDSTNQPADASTHTRSTRQPTSGTEVRFLDANSSSLLHLQSCLNQRHRASCCSFVLRALLFLTVSTRSQVKKIDVLGGFASYQPAAKF